MNDCAQFVNKGKLGTSARRTDSHKKFISYVKEIHLYTILRLSSIAYPNDLL